jgi:hypothetical protein
MRGYVLVKGELKLDRTIELAMVKRLTHRGAVNESCHFKGN